MSSNGFLNGPEIAVSFVTSPLRFCWRHPFLSLGVNSAGEWHCRTLQGPQPVLLLRSKSVWFSAFAGLTVAPDDGSAVVLWFLRQKSNVVAWRRLRAWALHGQAGQG